ncbi:hypothetical protein IW262DRAFT_1462087 [Armillaria fumosa]|nr:hypothetical protein IW262DRAFT_1462087 [Armillaria fumosa]
MVGVWLVDFDDGLVCLMLIHLFLSLIDLKFDSACYPGFLKFIDRFEVDIPFHGLVGSYTAGMHPYFEMQSSILNLPSAKGEHFYGCLLDIIRAFEYRYLHALLSPTPLPITVSLHSPPTLFHAHNSLPFEVLERIFTPTAYMRNAGTISLVGFASLLELHVEVPPSDLESVMLGCATWSSLTRLRPESQFTICLSHVGNGPQVKRALADPLILSVLCGMDTNDHRPL